ncbi:MAG: hypothetical protein ABI744_07400 [Chloroflexota bacterium]
MTLSNLALNAIVGIILGTIPSVLTRSRAYGRLSVDVGAGISGCVAMAWFLAPLSPPAASTWFAGPGILT